MSATPIPAIAAPERFASFGELLRFLRLRAGLRQMELAMAVGYSEAQIGRLEKDQRLPNVAMVRAQFVPALGLERDPALAARLVALAEAAHGQGAQTNGSPEPAATPAPAPPLRLDPNLPQPPTACLGRGAELAALAQLLAAPDHRLVTLLGPGGVGKTRLALEALACNAPTFAQGGGAVALATIPAPELLAPAVARALDLDVSREADPVSALGQHLQGQHLLLLLDNFEHLVEAAPQLGRLLAAAPRLRLLVTSRERLQLRGEVTLEVAGLPLPNDGGAGETLAANDAVQLFLTTAERRAALPPTRDTLATVARICALVEGLPLAIELAAAWTHLLSVDEIERELRRTLDFLQSTLRDLPARHRSLRAAFDHSWALLALDEQRALCHLSLFRGSFDAAAAAAVLGDAPATLPLLGALLDKSMVKRVGGSRSSRFGMHETIRQYAADRLHARPDEAEVARHRHGDYFLDLLVAHHAALRGADQQRALDTLAAEMDNLRAAVLGRVADHDWATLRRIFPTLALFLEWAHALQEGLALCAAIAEAARGAPPGTDEAARRSLLALALAYESWFSIHLGRSDRARAAISEAQGLAEAGDDALARGDVALFAGSMLGMVGDIPAARRLLRDSVRAFEACGDGWRVARSLYRLATLADQTGELVTAHHLFAASLRRLEAFGDLRARAQTLNRLGATAAKLGQLAEAQHFLEAGLRLARDTGDWRGEAVTLLAMGRVAQAQGEPGRARDLFRASVTLFARWREEPSAAETLAELGYSAVVEGDLAAARAAFAETWAWMRHDDTAHRLGLLILVGWAALRLAEGDATRAVEAAALALDHPASSQDCCNRAASVLRQAEGHLTPFGFVAAQGRGRAQTLHHFLPSLEDTRVKD